MNINKHSKLLLVLFTLDLILVFSHLFLASCNPFQIGEQIRVTFLGFLDVHGEANLQAWYSSSKLLIAGTLFGVIFVLTGKRGAAIGSLTLILLSADEGAQIHERFGQLLSLYLLQPEQTFIGVHSPHDWPYTYGFFGGLVLIGVIIFLYKERAFSAAVLKLLFLGIVVLLTGALGFEIIYQKISAMAYGESTTLLIFLATAYPEELLENFGSSLLLMSSILAFRDKFSLITSKPFDWILNASVISLPVLALLVSLTAIKLWEPPPRPFYEQVGQTQEWQGCNLPRIVGRVGKDCTSEFLYETNPGHLTFGPYTRIIPGNYEFKIYFSSPGMQSENVGKWDVVHGVGTKLLSTGELNGTDDMLKVVPGILEIEEGEKILDLEIRTYVFGNKALRIHKITIQRIK